VNLPRGNRLDCQIVCNFRWEIAFLSSQGVNIRATPTEVTAVVVTYGERSNKCAATIRAAFEAGVGRVLLVANGISDSGLLNVRELLAKDFKPVICCRVDANTSIC